MNTGIKFRVVSSLLVIGAIPLVGISGYTYQQGRDMAIKSAEDSVKIRAENIAAKIDGWTDTNRRVLQSIARNVQVKGMNPETLSPILKAAHSATDWHSVIFVSDNQGAQISRSDGEKNINWGDRGVFKALAAGKDFAIGTVIGADFGIPSVVAGVRLMSDDNVQVKSDGPVEKVAAPALSNGVFGDPAKGSEKAVKTEGTADNSNAKWIGTVGARSNLGSVSKFVEAGNTDAFVFSATPEGKIISHPAAILDRKLDSIKDTPEFLAAKTASGKFSFVDAKGEKMLGHSARTSTGWIVAYALPESQILAPVNNLTKNTAIITGAALLLISLAAWLLSAGIVSPITRLTQAADVMSKGDTSMDAEVEKMASRGDEIGKLAESVSRLSTAIQMAMSMIKKG